MPDIQKNGLFLKENAKIFSHGQINEALSRVSEGSKAVVIFHRKDKETRKKVWEKKWTASYGREEGEIYYEHLKTFETTNDRPDEYFSDEEILVDFDNDEKSLKLVKASLQLFKKSSNSVEMITEKLLESVNDSLNALIANEGETAMTELILWVKFFKDDKALDAFKSLSNLLMASLIQDNVNKATNCLEIVSTTLSLLLNLDFDESEDVKFDPTIIYRQVYREIVLSSPSKNLTAALSHSIFIFGSPEIKIKSFQVWSELVYNVITFSTTEPSQKFLQTSKKLISAIVEFLNEGESEEVVASCRVVCALCNLIKEVDGSESGQFSNSLIDHLVEEIAKQKLKPARRKFIEATQHIFNEATTNYKQNFIMEILRSQVLWTSKLLLGKDVKDDLPLSDAFYASGEIKLFIDVALTNVYNLLPEDETRSHFIHIIALAVVTNTWHRDLHRAGDIEKAMKDVETTELIPSGTKADAKRCRELLREAVDQ